MSFLGLENKKVLVVGVANKKSVAYHIAKLLVEEGATPIYVVKDEEIKQSVAKLLLFGAGESRPGDKPEIHTCDVENEADITRLHSELSARGHKLDGLVHSIAFANYSDGMRPFHETARKDFLQAVDISCFSLIALSSKLKDLFTPDSSIVTISISTTTMAAENYGYMAPVKAALDSTIVFLAKSFSAFSRARFNSVRAGLLKTSASAGIPGYVDSYLFAEKATLRKRAVGTDEVAATALFLLSPRSSGINAQGIVVDAGMSTNYFDRSIVEIVSKNIHTT
jgi:enoyl-[acyl-carrier protein] reductase I